MAIIEARINETEIFKLCSWNSIDFENTQMLMIQVDDPIRLKNAFNNVTKIEIFISNNLVATYTMFDSYSELTFMKEKIFVEHENLFIDAARIVLTRKNIIEQVEKLNAQINEVVDIESMTVEEYRTHVLSQISKACQEDIHNGDDIKISTGYKHYSYTTQDQIDLILNLLVIFLGQGKISYVPYHSDKNSCELVSANDMITIFFELAMSLLKKTTYCNAYNMHTRKQTAKESLSRCFYGMELDDEEQSGVDEIVSTTLAIIEEVIAKLSENTIKPPISTE